MSQQEHMDGSSRFHNWEAYPYRRFDPSSLWSLNVTPFQARHFIDNLSTYSHESFCVDVVTLEHNSTHLGVIESRSDLPRIETFTSEAAFLAHIQIGVALTALNQKALFTEIRYRQLIEIYIVLSCKKRLMYDLAFPFLLLSQPPRFVRSDLPISDHDVVDIDGARLENHEQELELPSTEPKKSFPHVHMLIVLPKPGNGISRPRITASALFKLCTMFDIQQSFLVSFRKDPHFSCHWVEVLHDPDKSAIGIPPKK